jgi:dephospho-CoA kinase
MVRVGVTGGIGSGKSTVTAALRAALEAAGRTVVVVDADVVARQVVEPGRPVLAALADRFGADVLTSDGRLDRARLAGIVFADPGARQDLSAIVNPAIRAEMARQAATTPDDGVCLLDVPLLVEDPGRTERAYDVVVVVEAPTEVRLERLEARGLGRDDAAARMAAQASDDERRALADHVVDNSGPVEALPARLSAAVADILGRLAAA